MRSTTLLIEAWTGSAWIWNYIALKWGTSNCKSDARLRKFSKCQNSIETWLVGPVWGCSSHFNEMAILQLLSLNKLATTLVKGAHPCKVSRLDFLISQTTNVAIVSKPCFTCFMTLLHNLSWSCYTNNNDMFQGMKNTCCIYMLH
jgi:hypothetical protein